MKNILVSETLHQFTALSRYIKSIISKSKRYKLNTFHSHGFSYTKAVQLTYEILIMVMTPTGIIMPGRVTREEYLHSFAIINSRVVHIAQPRAR